MTTTNTRFMGKTMFKKFPIPENRHYFNRYIKFITNILYKRPNEKFKDSEEHHILPRSMKGSNKKQNLIFLTYREHFIAHVLLAKSYPNHPICNALALLSQDGKIKLSRVFEQIRRSVLHCCQLGQNNSMFGVSRYGEENPMFGKKHSLESRKKISENIKTWHENNDNPFKGKTHSEETRKKLGRKTKSL